MFCDEATFALNAHLNKQKRRYWATCYVWTLGSIRCGTDCVSIPPGALIVLELFGNKQQIDSDVQLKLKKEVVCCSATANVALNDSDFGFFLTDLVPFGRYI